MKIASIEAIPLNIPFAVGGDNAGWDVDFFRGLDTVLVRVETDTGIVGWGDAFAYNCRRAVQAAVEDMVAPIALGHDAADIEGLRYKAQQGLHLFGRYGITMFALSGLDIALWDIAGKVAGKPLHALLAAGASDAVPAYASLFRYNDPDVVADRTAEAMTRGYGYIKLHEITELAVAAARRTTGDGMPIMVDTNCPWTPEEAMEMAVKLKTYDLFWLEEPIFPPEDFAALAALGEATGVAIAAGENACTAQEFAKMFDAGAVTYAQPSVTKVGGISEFLKVVELARAARVAVMPHSPYFGPGFLATLHLAAAVTDGGLVERFYVDAEASLYPGFVDPIGDVFRVPQEPGLGPQPDADVIKDYRA